MDTDLTTYVYVIKILIRGYIECVDLKIIRLRTCLYCSHNSTHHEYNSDTWEGFRLRQLFHVDILIKLWRPICSPHITITSAAMPQLAWRVLIGIQTAPKLFAVHKSTRLLGGPSLLTDNEERI